MSYVSVMDIGTSKITILVGNRSINNSLNIIGSFHNPYAGYYKGEFVEPEQLVEDITNTISNAESETNCKISKLFVGVPADFSICKTKKIIQSFGDKRKIDESDILEIYTEANELKNNEDYILISCSPIYFILDDGRQVINPIGERTSRISGEISYIYAEKKFIVDINVALRKYGIKEVEYLSSTLCENMYLLSEKEREKPTIIVNCGFISTSVSITKGNGLLALKSFSVGGGQIISDLNECLNLSYKDAEQLKKQIVLSVIPELSDGYEIKSVNKSSLISMVDANNVVSARIDMICNLISKCLTASEKKDLYKMPFYLTGGGICFIKGAKDYLSKYFGVNVDVLLPPNLQLSKPNYSTPLGLLNTAINQETKRKTSLLSRIIKKITKR